MAAKLQAPRGTFDVLPEDGERRTALRESTDALLGLAGYAPFETPVFEDTEVFARGVGQSTDIVQKEMFTFEDKGGRSLTLRPEGTAGACRAYVEHGMHKLPQPVKLRYWGPFFRHEAPQAGRYRQFNQIGAEALGSDDPSLDAELILLLAELLEDAEVDCRLRLSSLGNADTRAAYGEELRTYLRSRQDQLSDDVRGRIDANPLRAFDSDHAGTKAVMAEAPLLVDRLDPEDAEHFAEVPGVPGRRGAGVRPRPDAGARTGLLHAHGVRVREPRPGRAERRRRRRSLRRPRGSSSAAQPPPASAGPRGSSGSCWQARRARSWRCRWPTWPSPTPISGGPRSRSPRRCADRGCRPRWSRPAGR